MPSLSVVSMSSFEAMPVSSVMMASLMNGCERGSRAPGQLARSTAAVPRTRRTMSSRFEMKPAGAQSQLRTLGRVEAAAGGRRTGRVGRQRHRLAHALGKAARDVEDGRVGLERRDELDELHDRDRVDCAREEEGSAHAERGALAVALPPTPSTPSLAVMTRGDPAADEKERHAQKWNPTTCLARFSPVLELTADAARVDSEMLDVLLARMACGGRCVASEPKMACLMGSDSETACAVRGTRGGGRGSASRAPHSLK